MSLRVTHRSLYTSNLANLQNNLSRIQGVQERMSSGKNISAPSDSPGGTGAALRHRDALARGEQLRRNAYDGLGWLSSADSALSAGLDVLHRARELTIQASSPVVGPEGREAIAVEIEGLRETLLGVANTKYLDRPVFAGTADVGAAYAPDGTFLGNNNDIERSVRPGVSVRVNTRAGEAFGPPGADVFGFLTDLAADVRAGPAALATSLDTMDGHTLAMKNALTTVGARYHQVETMRDKNDEDLIVTHEQLSEIEDVDLPKAIVELQLQETAYQAALAATAKSVQPSLLDFLR